MPPRKILTAIGSRNFFGAERRFFRITGFILANRPDWTPMLIINSSLYERADEIDWAREVLDTLIERNALCVVPDRPSHLRDFRGIGILFAAVFGRQATHIVFRARPLAYLRALLGRRSIFEITSPDVADYMAGRIPAFLLKRCGVLRCASPSVFRRFRSRLQERFGTAPPLRSSDISCASIPFFYRQLSDSDVPPKENIIVSASRFIPRKNVTRFAEAVAEFLPSLPDWKVFILGQGEGEAAIRELLRPFIDRGQVVLGYEPRIESVLARSRIFVSLIEPDNYPSQGVLEAMLFGNALLLSDRGESGRFLDGERRNGVLTELDTESVISAIRTLTKKGDALEKMAAAGKRHLALTFSPEIFIDEMLAEHLALAERR
jgi:glycosyltransferase involved in cell wall biosynthesis